MDFENVNLKGYCFNLDLHKSMFFIDMLKDTYEFTLKGDEIEIFKKLKNGISEPITRKGLIYFIQVEMVDKYEYRSSPYQAKKDIAISGNHNIVHLGSAIKDFKDPSKEQTEEKKLHVHQWNVKLLIIMFYHLFGDIDSIHKVIDNMIYLEKYLNKKEESDEEVEVVDEEEEEEKVSEEELKMESLRLLRKQVEYPYEWARSLDESDSDGSAARGTLAVAEEEEINELGENKKLVLKNALEKESFSPITELFRPAWTT